MFLDNVVIAGVVTVGLMVLTGCFCLQSSINQLEVILF